MTKRTSLAIIGVCVGLVGLILAWTAYQQYFAGPGAWGQDLWSGRFALVGAVIVSILALPAILQALRTIWRRFATSAGPGLTSSPDPVEGLPGSHAPGPRWPALVGAALGVASGWASGWALRPTGDGIAGETLLALITVPGAVAFLATASLDRATLRGPVRAYGVWCAMVLGFLPVALAVTSLFSVISLLVLGNINDLASPLASVFGGVFINWYRLLIWILPALCGAGPGALLARWPVGMAGSGRVAVVKPPSPDHPLDD